MCSLVVGLGGFGFAGEADAVLALLGSLCGHGVVVGVVVLDLMEGFFGFFHNQLWCSVLGGCRLGWTSEAREAGHVEVAVVRAFAAG